MTDPFLGSLRAALADRYEIIHELGRGGMAVVVLAQDLRHHRRVAIKLLRQDVGSDVAADRFLQEIRTVAPLNHPHILPLYDSGKAAGQLFFVMPYVEGESLRQRLERGGPLPVEEAVRIAREVADALEFAHQRGIVHRDIKPENILLSAGHAVVADFGIARAADAVGLRLTDTGLAIGTPAYMSPEQTLADPRLDGRSDQYALGCVVYEMLAGHPPFGGATSRAIIARHTTDPVPPLQTVRPVAPALEAAIERALAKVPADRWPNMQAFAEALQVASPAGSAGTAAVPAPARAARRWRVAALVGGVGIVALALWAGRRMAEPPTRDADSPHSVVVLPFLYSGDSSLAVLVDGIFEGITAGLVRVEGLAVPSGGTSRIRALQERYDDPQEVGRALGVDYLVHGEIQARGRGFRIVPKLTDVRAGTRVWQHSFSGEIGDAARTLDLFAMQDSIAQRIVEAILPELPAARRVLAARGIRTEDLEALRLYSESRGMPEDLEGNLRALALLERAVARDPTFSDAWVDIAMRQFNSYGVSGSSVTEVALKWRQAVENAIEHDSLNARAFYARGSYRSSYEWDHAGAERDYRRAMQLNPADLDILQGRAISRSFTDQRDSGLVYARRAVRLDSLSAWTWNILGKVYAFNGMLDSAILASERSFALDSTMWHSNWVLANGYLTLGRRAEAERAAARLPRFSSLRAHFYRRAGDQRRARVMLDSLEARADVEVVPSTGLAAWRLAAGDQGRALDALEEALHERDIFLAEEITLHLASLRGNPRFDAIRRRVYGDRPMMPPPFP